MDEIKMAKDDSVEIVEILKRISIGDQKMVLGFVKCIEAMRGENVAPQKTA